MERLLIGLELDADLADVPARPGPVRVRLEQHVAVADLPDHERPVANEILRVAPRVPELLAAMTGPGEGPGREQVREVAPRLADSNLERPVVESLGARDVREQEGSRALLLLQPAPGEREVLGRDGHAVAPAGLLAQAEEVREPVARDAEVVRDVRHDCQRVVDGEQPAEQVPDDLHALRRVDVARNEVRGLVQYRLEALRRLGARRLLDAAIERLVVGRLGPLEVEGEVVRQRDLEQRVAGALLVAEAGEEVAGAAVVLEGLAVGVQRPGRVARLQQIVDGPRRLVCLAEVPREQREDLVARAPD